RRRCKPISTHASITRRPPDWTRNSTSRRPNSCLLIDNTATTAHLPGPQNPRECHLYLAEGCHFYFAPRVTLLSCADIDCRGRPSDNGRMSEKHPYEAVGLRPDG